MKKELAIRTRTVIGAGIAIVGLAAVAVKSMQRNSRKFNELTRMAERQNVQLGLLTLDLQDLEAKVEKESNEAVKEEINW